MPGTLNTQVWTGQLMEGFYPDTSFLNYVKNFTEFVDNDKINLAEAGIDPEVLLNNTVYPIGITQREDTPIEITLDKYETVNSVVRRPEVIEYAYDQLESVLMSHRNALRKQTALKAAYMYSPVEDTSDTPVIKFSTDIVAAILDLKERYDEIDCPLEKRYLCLSPKHERMLIEADTKSFKDITDVVNGQPKRFAGFNMLKYTRPAFYIRSTEAKAAYGVAYDDSIHCISSFAFHGDEVMKADGSVFLYNRPNDPELRGTVIGFDKRFIALPLRNKAIGAIIS